MGNPVISPTAPQWGKIGPGLQSLSVAPFNQGDLMVLALYVSGGPVTAVTGGGVADWQCASSYYDTTGLAYEGIWWGPVTTPGVAAVSFTAAGQGAGYGTLWAWEFTAPGAHWAVASAHPGAHSTGAGTGTTGTPVLYPALSPSAGGNDLYVGAGWSYYGHLSAGSTPGFLYANPAANGENQVCWNPSVNSTVSPESVNNSSTYLTVAAVFTAGAGVATSPAYASGYNIIGGGLGSWSNPGNAVGVPSGPVATWTAP